MIEFEISRSKIVLDTKFLYQNDVGIMECFFEHAIQNSIIFFLRKVPFVRAPVIIPCSLLMLLTA